ncbi:MAG: ABC transporter permease [Chelatococcus sp.]|uniref:ABC transporter permease n=1 Tax=Chelatococcus sp. TaxID=1953771 RepID=UPI0025BE6CC0|nr:ABC transporter permease [Chelatococcus sp.]MBX3540135.1 ABC transporter permease [Chelatococcus sp.]
MRRLRPWIGPLYAILVIAFLLSPLLIVIVVSFSADEFVAFPPAGFSLRWFEALRHNEDMLRAFLLSAEVAALAAAIGLVVGLPTALLLVRYRWRADMALRALALGPLILPEVLLGLALLQFSESVLRQAPQFWYLVVAHGLIVLPFCVQMISNALTGLNLEVEDAAQTLGATPLQTFWLVTLPSLRNGVASALLLSFIFSFDNVAISLFLTSPGLATLPIRMYEHATYSSDPLLAAISAVLIVLGMAFMLLIGRLRGFGNVAHSSR